MKKEHNKNKSGTLTRLHNTPQSCSNQQYWHKYIHIDKWDKIKNLEISLCTYSQLDFFKSLSSYIRKNCQTFQKIEEGKFDNHTDMNEPRLLSVIG